MDPADTPPDRAAAPAAAPARSDGPVTNPGIRTSEFAISAATFALGAYLILSGRNEPLGGELVIWATAGYAASRALTKGGIASIIGSLRR